MLNDTGGKHGVGRRRGAGSSGRALALAITLGSLAGCTEPDARVTFSQEGWFATVDRDDRDGQQTPQRDPAGAVWLDLGRRVQYVPLDHVEAARLWEPRGAEESYSNLTFNPSGGGALVRPTSRSSPMTYRVLRLAGDQLRAMWLDAAFLRQSVWPVGAGRWAIVDAPAGLVSVTEGDHVSPLAKLAVYGSARVVHDDIGDQFFVSEVSGDTPTSGSRPVAVTSAGITPIRDRGDLKYCSLAANCASLAGAVVLRCQVGKQDVDVDVAGTGAAIQLGSHFRLAEAKADRSAPDCLDVVDSGPTWVLSTESNDLGGEARKVLYATRVQAGTLEVVRLPLAASVEPGGLLLGAAGNVAWLMTGAGDVSLLTPDWSRKAIDEVKTGARARFASRRTHGPGRGEWFADTPPLAFAAESGLWSVLADGQTVGWISERGVMTSTQIGHAAEAVWARGDTAWLLLNDGSLQILRATPNGVSSGGTIRAAGRPLIAEVVPYAGNRSAIVTYKDGTFGAFRHVSESRLPVISLGDIALPSGDATVPRVPIGLKGIAYASSADKPVLEGDGIFSFREDTAGAHLRIGIEQDGVPNSPDFQSLASGIVPLPSGSSPFDFAVTYEDDHGSHVAWKWSGLRARMPWWRTPAAISHAFALTLVVVFLLLARNAGQTSKLVRTLPMALVAALAGGGSLGAIKSIVAIPFDPALVWIDLGAAGVCLALVSYWHASMFRVLAAVAPYQELASFALLRSPVLRRRVFGDYVRQVEDALSPSDGVGAEHYVDLPAMFEVKGATPALETRPAVRIERRLGGQPPLRLLVKAPGGRGKSALVRDLVRRAIAAHRAHASRPIPVVCRLDGKSWSGMISSALGHHRISDSALAQLVEGGAFVVVGDGFSESNVPVASLDDFARSTAGRATAIVVASRPDRALDAVVASLPGGEVADLLPLTDPEPLRTFVAAYSEVEGTGDSVDDCVASLRAAVKAFDGTYSPILVRFALHARARRQGVVGVYDSALEALAKRGEHESDRDFNERLAAAVAAARLLALQSYWRDHKRAFRIDEGTPAERRAWWSLKTSGVLVEAAQRTPLGVLPGHFVRFIHDSMQTYCAAAALVDEPGFDDVKTLRAAASDVRLRRDVADLFGYSCPEIFGMLVAILGERDATRLLQVLQDDVFRWATLLDSSLARQTVLDAMPRPVRERLAGSTGPDPAGQGVDDPLAVGRGMSVEPLVRRACGIARDGEHLVLVASLYAVLAPPAIEAEAR